MNKLVSIVIPCFNEGKSLENTFGKILKTTSELNAKLRFEYIFVDDGSSDDTVSKINRLIDQHRNNDLRLIAFSRNFGKEVATTAGIKYSQGDAIIMIDADGQHPAELIKKLIKYWEEGDQVVVGVRVSNRGEGYIKKYGSKLFYSLYNKWSGSNIKPGSTDYRLIDRLVANSFLNLKESDRITRALIDWLGYKRSYISFNADARYGGDASYSINKLIGLAFNSFVSMSYYPLYFIGYLGLIIMAFSLIVSTLCFVEDILLNDPLGLHITGSAYIGLLILFMVGIIIFTQGLMSLYISKIYKETKARPLYIVDYSKSSNIS